MLRGRLKTTLLTAVLLGCVLSGLFLYVHAKTTRPSGPLSPAQDTINRMFETARLCSKYRTFVGYWPTNILFVRAMVPVKNPSVLTDAWGRPFVLSVDSRG